MDDEPINLDLETTLKYVEKKVDKIKKSKNIKKSETMIVKAKTKLLESENTIEIFEKELNSDTSLGTPSDIKLEILYDQLNKLNEQFKNNTNIEEGIKLYQEMKQLIETIKYQLNSYKMKIIYI